jgi:predicted membrane protein
MKLYLHEIRTKRWESLKISETTDKEGHLMIGNPNKRLGSGAWFGLVLVALGGLLLLPSFGVHLDFNLWDLWPLILVAIGISHFFQRRFAAGALWIAFGFFFLGVSLDWYHFRWHTVWALLIIAAGLLILSNQIKARGGASGGTAEKGIPVTSTKTAEGSKLELQWFLGGGRHVEESKSFRGGSVAAFLSSGVLDLRNADFQDEAAIDTLSFLGKVEILVPDSWDVAMQGTSILGNMKHQPGFNASIKPRTKPAKTRRLVIKGLAFLGDVEVKAE